VRNQIDHLGDLGNRLLHRRRYLMIFLVDDARDLHR
jgi:hypothetical protein